MLVFCLNRGFKFLGKNKDEDGSRLPSKTATTEEIEEINKGLL